VQHRLNRKFPAEMDFAHDGRQLSLPKLGITRSRGIARRRAVGPSPPENGMTHLEFFMQATSVRDVWALSAAGTSIINASVESSK
jgi:hypothetical protein